MLTIEREGPTVTDHPWVDLPTRAAVYAEREERLRRELEAGILDPRLYALYTDRTVVDLEQAANDLGVTKNAINVARMGGRRRQQPPHPSALIHAIATKARDGGGRPIPGFEIGEVRVWAVQTQRKKWHAITGELVNPDQPPAHGMGGDRRTRTSRGKKRT